MGIRSSEAIKYVEYSIFALSVALVIFAVASYISGSPPFFVETDNPSSMGSTISYGSLVLAYKEPFSSIGVGDIIVFHDPRGDPRIIMHRVVAVVQCGTSRCLETKGDNNVTNPIPDPWNVTASDYIGSIVLVVPYVGYLSPSMWSLQGLPLYALLASAALVFIIIHLGGCGT